MSATQPGTAAGRALLERTEPFGECLVWTGARDKYGYSVVLSKGRSRNAHRVLWELERGPVPDGLTLDHLCRVRACINLDHLEPVTNRENILRGISPSAIHARKTHCPHGHPYSPENTHLRPNGRRACLACRAARSGQRRACPQCSLPISVRNVLRHQRRMHGGIHVA